MRFTWWLDNEKSASLFALDDEPPTPSDQISGVLVRSIGWIDPAGWEPDDLAYMQTEMQAALLAWLWSLDCPVVNRYPSAIWYYPQVPLLFWQRLLRRCGLPVLETLVTNVEQEAHAFRQRLAQEAVAGAVYGPLTSAVRYLVTSTEDWNGLATMQHYTPVSLTIPYGAIQSVCMVGERVIWEGEPSPEMIYLEPALQRFAAAVGLAFLELAFAPSSDGVCIIAVEPRPHFERFGETARQQIVDGIVDLLTMQAGKARKGAGQVFRGGTW